MFNSLTATYHLILHSVPYNVKSEKLKKAYSISFNYGRVLYNYNFSMWIWKNYF